MKSSCLIFIALALLLLLAGCVAAPSQPPITVVVTVVAPTPDGVGLLTGVSPLPLPDWPEGHAEFHTEGSNPFQVSVDDVEALTETVVITFTLRGGAAQSPLFDAPTLEDVAPLADSLEKAQFALLRLATRGRVTASLEFPRPEREMPWTLVFNPEHERDCRVAPRVEVNVE